METLGCPDFDGEGFKLMARRAATNATRPGEALHLDSGTLGRMQSLARQLTAELVKKSAEFILA